MNQGRKRAAADDVAAIDHARKEALSSQIHNQPHLQAYTQVQNQSHIQTPTQAPFQTPVHTQTYTQATIHTHIRTRPTIEPTTKSKLTWVEYDFETPVDSKVSRAITRKHAALASAATRKATIARKQKQQQQQQQQQQSPLASSSSASSKAKSTALSQRPRYVDQTVQIDGGILRGTTSVSENPRGQTASIQIADYVSSLLGSQQGSMDRPAMAYKTIRTLLSSTFVNHPILFQTALFVAGTHSNTCGVPPFALHPGMGTGLILLRGCSLNAIQAAVCASDGDSATSVAIALLAGWERRFGDRESFEVHIKAWKSLSLPPGALEENNIATLAELALESFREGLNERASTNSLNPSNPNAGDRFSYPVGLPPGFKVMRANRPEAISVLNLVSKFAHFEIEAPDAVSKLRALALENMAWGPSHSIKCEPSLIDEEAWDQAELSALLHIRACLIAVSGVWLEAVSKVHGLSQIMDIRAGLRIHVEACQHLRTEMLLGTRYQEVALWARFTLCATTRDEPRDELLRSFLKRRGIGSWDQFKMMLEPHIYSEQLLGADVYNLYELLTKGSGKSTSAVYSSRATPVAHSNRATPAR